MKISEVLMGGHWFIDRNHWFFRHFCSRNISLECCNSLAFLPRFLKPVTADWPNNRWHLYCCYGRFCFHRILGVWEYKNSFEKMSPTPNRKIFEALKFRTRNQQLAIFLFFQFKRWGEERNAFPILLPCPECSWIFKDRKISGHCF